ncbi:glucokinase [Myotisia sp. PD_48]|nr:glucokinase [Myotisia sp. PD_48]
MASSPVITEAKRIAAEFDYRAEDVNRGVKEFMREMQEGLDGEGTNLSQIPSYITRVPDGSEKGIYLAVDLGGTNFRVCSIQIHGDSTFSITQTKTAIPRNLMVTEHGTELFNYLAQLIEEFLQKHHGEHFSAHVQSRRSADSKEPYPDELIFDLGFTFSFPVFQNGINRGKLYRWTKGFDISEVVGKDVCLLLQAAIDERHLPVHVAALVNDTVGTLMARSYCSPSGDSKTLIGAIFGTGTNGAYVEKLSRIKKMSLISGGDTYDKTTGKMVVNVEWGSFDTDLKVLPDTEFDKLLDNGSVNPGIQLFEKRISGMFLGEILRFAILSMVNNPAVKLFNSPAIIAEDSSLYENWGIDTSFLSIVEGDSSDDSASIKAQLKKELNIENVSTTDCQAIKHITHAIGKRAARLGAVALAAIIITSDRLATDDIIDIGVDGSLIEFYPGFEHHIRGAFRDIPEIGVEGEKKIRIGIAKDGSGVGAALGALVAKQTTHINK